MHEETPRDRSTAGRFPSITLGAEDDAEGEAAGPEESETACRRWLRKVFPCCPPKPNNDNDTLVTVTDGDEKEVELEQEKPETGGGDLEGERGHGYTGYYSAGNTHDLTVMFP